MNDQMITAVAKELGVSLHCYEDMARGGALVFSMELGRVEASREQLRPDHITALVKNALVNSTYGKGIQAEYNVKVEELNKQIVELSKYKIFYDLYKGLGTK